MDDFLSKLNDFRCGQSHESWTALGAHPAQEGYTFAVWAPDARYVAVIGPWNGWNPTDALQPVGSTGVWYGAAPRAASGDLYKYYIEMHDGSTREKADPFAFAAERQPGTASVLTDLSGFRYYDAVWRAHRASLDLHDGPFSILSVDPLDWRDADGAVLPWPALAERLIPLARDGGYTHLCLTGVLHYPREVTHGAEITGFFAPDARCGAPFGLMQLLDACHRAGLGVLLDWTPGYFAPEYFGLGRFNGTALYETAQNAPNGCYKFNLASGPVRSFLVSCARFWLTAYHFDGLQFRGLGELLQLAPGVPDPDAPALLRALTRTVHTAAPGAIAIARDCADAKSYGFDFYWDEHWQSAVRRAFSESGVDRDLLAAAVPTDPAAILPLPRTIPATIAPMAALWQDACPGVSLRCVPDTGVGLVSLNEPAFWGQTAFTWQDAPAPLLHLLRGTGQNALQIVLNPGDAPQPCPALPGDWNLVFSTDPPSPPTLSNPVPAHGGCIYRRRPEDKTVPELAAQQEDHQ